MYREAVYHEEMPGYGFGLDESDALSEQEEDVLCEDANAFDSKTIPKVNRVFRKTPLWEGKELPEYDDRDAGPANMPNVF